MQMIKSTTLVFGALMAAVSLGVQAQQGEGAFEIGASANYYVPNGNRNLGDNGMLYGPAIGYYLTDDVSMELTYGEYDNIDRTTSGHKSVNGSLSGLNAVYHFGTVGDNLRPYVSAGYAYQSLGQSTNIGQSKNGRKHSDYANIATGLKYYFTETLFAGASITGMYNTDDSDGEYMAGLMIGTTFGGKTPMVEEPAPVACTDEDNDGVCDNIDKCPGTEANVTVDADGCPAAQDVRVELDVKFDFDKDVVKEESYSEIKTVADFMTQYPQTTTTVEGHTDSVGSDAYNQDLSQRRADAVRQVMVDQYGVGADRVTAAGEGESNPVADNATEEGRALNRRVEASVEAQAK